MLLWIGSLVPCLVASDDEARTEKSEEWTSLLDPGGRGFWSCLLHGTVVVEPLCFQFWFWLRLFGESSD